jgi:hypothetical protein
MEPERPSARSNPARGVALIATAVVIGLFILRNGFDEPSSGDITAATEAAAGDTTSSTAAGDGGQGEGAGTTEAPPARPAAEVTVMVANTTSVGGAAGGLTETVAGLGYPTAPAANVQPPVEATQVLFTEGFEREAAALAQAIQAPADGVAAMPAPPPTDLGGAQVLVLLGPDLAGG